MSIRYSTLEIEPQYRHRYWIETICKSLMHLQISIPKKENFHGVIQTDHLAYIQFSKATADKSIVTRSRSEISKANSQLIHLLFQQREVVSLKQDSKYAEVYPGQWVLCDTTRPSEFVIHHDQSETLVLQLDKAKLKAKLPNLEQYTAQSLSLAHGLGKVVTSYISSVYSELKNLDETASLAVAESMIDILSSNLQQSVTNSTAEMHSPSTTLLEIKHFIQANLSDPNLSILSIASALNISKRYIHLLFKDEEITVNRYLWNKRLEQCQSDLQNPHLNYRSITDIALSWGFKNSAHFSSLFAKKYGLSPREYRKSS